MAHHGMHQPREPAQPTDAYASRAIWNSASGGPPFWGSGALRQNCALAKPPTKQATQNDASTVTDLSERIDGYSAIKMLAHPSAIYLEHCVELASALLDVLELDRC